MPSISDLVKQNQARIAKGENLVVPAESTPAPAGPPPPIQPGPPPAVTGLPVRGYYPQGSSLDGDFAGTAQVTRTGVGMRSPTFPKQPSSITTIVKSVASAIATTASSFVYKVNNLVSPVQSVLNILQGTGMQINMDGAGNVTFISTSSGDGLTHSTAPWESDPAYNIWREDFFSGNAGASSAAWTTNISLANGWVAQGSLAVSGWGGGVPPYLGQLFWGPANVVNTTGMLMPNTLQSTNESLVGGGKYYPDIGMALFDNPGWQMSWVFKFDNPRSTAQTMTNVKQATYIGLAGITSVMGATSTNPVSRPDVFFGVRYDTSAAVSATITAVANAAGGTTVYTTSSSGGANFAGRQFTVSGCSTPANNGTWDCTTSSAGSFTLRNPSGVNSGSFGTITSAGIADSFLTLEAVENYSYNTAASRNNTQGTTLVTSTVPVAGVWHRLDITCNAAGSVTITLDGTSSLTATVSQMTISGTGNWLTGSVVIANHVELSYTPGNAAIQPAINPFSVDSQITVAGFSGTQAPLNGTFSQRINDTTAVGTVAYDVVSVAAVSASVNGTIKGYPAVIPVFMVGNDDTASPTLSPRLLFVDYFSLVWNPNLGPNAPGTPVATKPRYW